MARRVGPAVTARVALATAAAAVDLDDDALLLRDALAARGVDAALCVWDDPAVDWASWDLTVLRSTWDYPRRRDEFVRWATQVATVGALRNRPDVVAWNCDKRYLLELERDGVPIVPSWVHPPGDGLAVPDDGPYVVKPAVSAGAQDTARFAPGDGDAARRHGARLHAEGRPVLVQPYLDRVDERGETALVYLGDRFSHAIRKGPILAGTPTTVGGLYAEEDITPRDPAAAERAVAEAALDALPFARAELLYARVDLLPAPDGAPLVLEVELIEPSLFLGHDDDAADRFARAIADAL